MGLKTREIAARLRVSECTVRPRRTAPAFRAEVVRVAAEIRETVVALTAQELVGAEPVRVHKGQGASGPASLRGPR